jgi:hypothetical protein
MAKDFSTVKMVESAVRASVCLARALKRWYCGIARAERIPTIATATRSSMRVKPD